MLKTCPLLFVFAPAYCTALTESEDTTGCNNTICPPEDEHSTARNMLRIIM